MKEVIWLIPNLPALHISSPSWQKTGEYKKLLVHWQFWCGGAGEQKKSLSLESMDSIFCRQSQ